MSNHSTTPTNGELYGRPDPILVKRLRVSDQRFDVSRDDARSHGAKVIAATTAFITASIKLNQLADAEVTSVDPGSRSDLVSLLDAARIASNEFLADAIYAIGSAEAHPETTPTQQSDPATPIKSRPSGVELIFRYERKHPITGIDQIGLRVSDRADGARFDSAIHWYDERLIQSASNASLEHIIERIRASTVPDGAAAALECAQPQLQVGEVVTIDGNRGTGTIVANDGEQSAIWFEEDPRLGLYANSLLRRHAASAFQYITARLAQLTSHHLVGYTVKGPAGHRLGTVAMGCKGAALILTASHRLDIVDPGVLKIDIYTPRREANVIRQILSLMPMEQPESGVVAADAGDQKSAA